VVVEGIGLNLGEDHCKSHRGQKMVGGGKKNGSGNGQLVENQVTGVGYPWVQMGMQSQFGQG